MKDRRTKEEILAEHESLKAAHVALADMVAKLDADLKASKANAEAAWKSSSDFERRYYKLLEEKQAHEVRWRDERDHAAVTVAGLAEQAQRYSAMRGAVIALAGKAKADEIDGFTQ